MRRSRVGFLEGPRPLVEPVSAVEEGYFDSFAFYRRVGLAAAVAITAFALLVLRAWSLQLLHSVDYLRQSQAEQTRIVNLPAARGLIVDDKMRPLASAGAQLAVVADATELGPAPFDKTWQPSKHGRKTLVALSAVTYTPVSTYVARIRASLVQSPFGPAVIVSHAPKQLTFYLDERVTAFPGVHVEELPTRDYPQGGLGGEFLGLLGQVSAAELTTPEYKHAKAGEEVGQSGVEATYDKSLNGGFAHAKVRVNAVGEIASPLRPIRTTTAPAGLQLTIDAPIQRAAEQAVKDGIAFAHTAGYTDASAGAAVVMDVHTGAIKALASYPTVNQTLAANDPAYLDRLISGKQPGLPLLNRATQGLYPAGSTFKPIVAEAALTDGVITPNTYLACTGALTVGNIVFHNVEPSINESMNLSQAIAMSCDTWFYQLGERLYFLQEKGLLGIQQWAGWLGLGKPTGIDIPGEAGGVVPTPKWLAKTFAGTAESYWYEGTSVNLSIGQGYLEVTPLQMAVAYAALANGGTVVRPHVAQAVIGAHRKMLKFPPVRKLKLTDVWAIRQGLYDAAHSSTGTSTAIFGNFPVAVSGKTGTAQDPHGSDDSWYASYAPSGNPRYVVVVLIEHGGFGATAAAPAAKEIWSKIFGVES
ncbi:MAG TPA: penicillin-binding transpeptidase domain-containing protein [Gaiellaceae bacterium]